MEHFKIISARNFTKMEVDHKISNFKVFLTYETLVKNSSGCRNMEGRWTLANLAISNSMAKLVCHSGMRIVRYNGTALIIKIGDPIVQNSSLS